MIGVVCLSLSFQTKIDLFQVFEGRCGYCGEKLAFDKMTIDHIFPRCFGGDDGFDNLICCCKGCNQRKGSFSLEVFRYREGRRTGSSPYRFYFEQFPVNRWPKNILYPSQDFPIATFLDASGRMYQVRRKTDQKYAIFQSDGVHSFHVMPIPIPPDFRIKQFFQNLTNQHLLQEI